MRKHTGQSETLSDSELNQLFKRLTTGNHSERNTATIGLGHYAGLRAKEIASLKIADVFDENDNICNVLHLQAAYTKGHRHRDIPLSNTKLRKILQNWITYRKKLDGAVFNLKAPLFTSQKGLAFSPNSLSRMLNNLYRLHGYSGCTSHCGRRSLITKLVNRGVSVNKVQVLAGHSSIQTTMGYVRTDPNQLSEIMKAL